MDANIVSNTERRAWGRRRVGAVGTNAGEVCPSISRGSGRQRPMIGGKVNSRGARARRYLAALGIDNRVTSMAVQCDISNATTMMGGNREGNSQ
uniref:Uncharacterized protein n=1 Tax=Oryza meridionalis TaxID=40149 RepID=A0A0E0DJ05_9ORYZ